MGRRQMMTKQLIFALSIGAVSGTLLRYGLSILLNKPLFPLGTLCVNIVGCLLIGILASLSSSAFPIPKEVRIGLQVGFLGSFTTFSSFGYETMRLVEEGRVLTALINVLANNGIGLGAVWAGSNLARVLTRSIADRVGG